MLLSRAKAAIQNISGNKQVQRSTTDSTVTPNLKSFLNDRDYCGALAILEFERYSGAAIQPYNWLWTGYAAFHLGDYTRALRVYTQLINENKDNSVDPLYYLYLAVVQFYLGMYNEADMNAKKGPQCKLQNRLHFHVSHKLNDEKQLMIHHQNLQDVVEDQLCLASIHYLRGHYQEAIDIYKRLLGEHPEYLALNIYLALCYYKLDYYDVAQEVLTLYLNRVPDSVTAGNLKACNQFRLFNGKSAEQELNALLDRMSSAAGLITETSFPSSVTRKSQAGTGQQFGSDILKHNRVVFKNGEGALNILEPLVDVVPEARLNLALWHLRQDDITPAYELMKDVDPSSPSEYILKAIVYAILGQAQDSRDLIKQAQQNFQLVGSSASECDTIAGRQCMASCFFLLRHFDDVLVYLNSIKAYFQTDDSFNYNYGQTKVALGAWKEALDAFSAVHDDKLHSEFTFISHLAMCYIKCSKAQDAWELYLKMGTSSDSFVLLKLIANESYRSEQYLYAAKAFDVLERLDPTTPEYWEGKRGACIGVFQAVVQGRAPRELIKDVLILLRNSNNVQADFLVKSMRRWIGS